MMVWIVTQNVPMGEYHEDVQEYIGVAATLDEAKELVRKRESWKGVAIEWNPQFIGYRLDSEADAHDVWFGAGSGVSTGLYTARRCDGVNNPQVPTVTDDDRARGVVGQLFPKVLSLPCLRHGKIPVQEAIAFGCVDRSRAVYCPYCIVEHLDATIGRLSG